MRSETDQARLFAYKLINYRPRSQSELERRLERKGYSREVVDIVIKYLARLGYIEDKAFARYWISCRAGKRGSYGLRKELLEKGVDTAVINESLAEFGPEEEFNSALKMAQKKIALCGGTCPYPRLTSFLKCRGFSYDVINRVVVVLGRGEA